MNHNANPADPAAASDAAAASAAAAAPPPAAVAAPAAAPAATTTTTTTTTLSGPALIVVAAVIGALSVASLTLTLLGQQRVKALEQELVRRQQDMQTQSIEARSLAKQAQDAAQSTETRMSLLDARVSETAMQRSQLEELIQQLSRSRDENALADIDAALRVAMQQGAITGSAEPLVQALRQAEERVGRMAQPRLERVRRALVRDLDRARAVAVADVGSLAIKLDETIRAVDDLPLLSQYQGRPSTAANTRTASTSAVAAARAASAAAVAAAAADKGHGLAGWWPWLGATWVQVSDGVLQELRALVRVTQIDHPEAMLLAPDHAYFLRENLKLRLLNARLALLSRQFDTVQSDLRDAQSALDRYFDASHKRVIGTTDLMRQVAGQSRLLNLPKPDESLAALTAAQSGR